MRLRFLHPHAASVALQTVYCMSLQIFQVSENLILKYSQDLSNGYYKTYSLFKWYDNVNYLKQTKVYKIVNY